MTFEIIGVNISKPWNHYCMVEFEDVQKLTRRNVTSTAALFLSYGPPPCKVHDKGCARIICIVRRRGDFLGAGAVTFNLFQLHIF